MAENVVEEIKQAPKKSKKKLHPADKRFIELAKLLFSSLSGRICAYAFFNVIEDGFILSNSTNPPKGKSAPSYHDRLTEYSVSELALHFVKVKDPDFLLRLRKICGIPEKGYWCLFACNAVSMIGLKDLDNLVLTPGDNGMVLMSPRGVPLNALNKRNIVGAPVTSFHVIKNLLEWWLGVQHVDSDEFRENMVHAVLPISEDTIVVDRGYSIPFRLDLFKRKDGSLVFKDTVDTMKIEAIEGVDGVSLREFVRRVANRPYTYEMLLWVLHDTYILHMTRFENDVVEVRTFRPNVALIPLDKNVPIINKDLLRFSEEKL